jgi:hypothetical protein
MFQCYFQVMWTAGEQVSIHSCVRQEVDSLFSSFSCVANNSDHHKVLRCRLSSKSKHLEHWEMFMFE